VVLMPPEQNDSPPVTPEQAQSWVTWLCLLGFSLACAIAIAFGDPKYLNY